MDIRQMNRTHLDHWRGLRKQLWPGHPDDAHLADGEEILQADHLASFVAIAKVVNKRVPVIFDSGVRRGSHIFKALASGADIVAVGRPVLYGLNLGGAQGVASVIEQLNKELTINMMLGGARNIEQVKTTRLLTEKDLPQ